MRIKRQYYDVNGTMAFTFVLYKRDLDHIDKNYPRLLDVAGNSDNSVNVLHALILIAEKIERNDGRQASETKTASSVQGVPVSPA